jgi:UDP-N-acetylglucosamine 1-carboxyvinyltransferase
MMMVKGNSMKVFKAYKRPLMGNLKLDGGKHGFSHDAPVAALADKGILTNVPNIIDSLTLMEVFRLLFEDVNYDVLRHEFEFSKPFSPREIYLDDKTLARSRSIFGMLPAILHRGHTLSLDGLPEGCSMGDRPTDWYFDVLTQFGVEIKHTEKRMLLTWSKRVAPTIQFEYPTMTGTVIAIAAASVTSGRTMIKNGSIEPSCLEEINCAKSMGVKFEGVLPELTIIGADNYDEVNWQVLHDRVHAATFLTAGLLSRGNVSVEADKNLGIPEFVNFLKMAGVKYVDEGNRIEVWFPEEKGFLDPVRIDTGSEPLFSSDWMAPLVLLLAARSKGKSIITDNVFPDRLQCLDNLRKIGLDNVTVEKTLINGRKALLATIEGNPDLRLDGGEVGTCTDLRGSTALALAALISDNDITIEDDFHLRRGYEDYEKSIAVLTGGQ